MTSFIQRFLFTLALAGSFYLMEAFLHNPFSEVRFKAQLLNILLFELLGWGFYFLTKSMKVSFRIILATAWLFGIINYYVMEFRSTPFVPWDIYSIKTAASVASNYDFHPTGRMFVITGAFLLLWILSYFWSLRLSCGIVGRCIASALAIAILLLFADCLQDESFQKKAELYPFLFTPAHMTKVNGMAVTFVMDMAYVKVDKPKGYKREEAKDLLAAYEEPEKAEDLVNMIVIMDEAFSDLSVLGPVNASKDYMPFIHSLQAGYENTVTGNLHVSVYGGNTANTEYEFLTGNSMAELPPGSIPYQQYIKSEMPSLASDLKELGYVTYAMHPYNSTGWQRNEVYPRLGFEKAIFLKDLTGVEKLRTYASDAYDFKQIIRIYENKNENQPMFLFNVTMQNHGSYVDTYDNFVPTVTVEGIKSVALSQYLSLIRQTDEDFRQLVSYFSNEKEKTMIVFFGDHQPSNAIGKYIITEETKETDKYLVPYVIWANFDIQEGKNEDLSANFLASRALELAGIPASSYQQFLTKVRAAYPVYSAIETIEMPEGEQKDKEALLEDYRSLQYYRLMDWKEK